MSNTGCDFDAWNSCRTTSEAAAAAARTTNTVPVRESIPDLVAQKREIFLINMGLDVKAAEIAKLQAAGTQRVVALTKGEKLLDEDAKRFEDFLAESSAKLQEAVAKADAETRAKQEKARLLLKHDSSCGQELDQA